MKVLLVAATGFELAPFLRSFKPKRQGNLYSFQFSSKIRVDVLITGVGMVSTAFEMGKNSDKKYDLVINAGICGSYVKGLMPGTVCRVVKDKIAELGAESGSSFIPGERLGFKSAAWLFPVNVKSNIHALKSYPKVKGITVNRVNGSAKSIAAVRKQFKPDIESMEGAAFFHACKALHLPCLQLRSVSNYVEVRNKRRWRTGLAIRNLNQELVKVLQSI